MNKINDVNMDCIDEKVRILVLQTKDRTHCKSASAPIGPCWQCLDELWGECKWYTKFCPLWYLTLCHVCCTADQIGLVNSKANLVYSVYVNVCTDSLRQIISCNHQTLGLCSVPLWLRLITWKLETNVFVSPSADCPYPIWSFTLLYSSPSLLKLIGVIMKVVGV